MITLIYSKEGIPINDFEIVNVVKSLIEKAKKEDVIFNTSSETVITAFRLEVKQKNISYEDIIIEYHNSLKIERILLDKNAKCDVYPNGFCDLNIFLTHQLLKIKDDLL